MEYLPLITIIIPIYNAEKYLDRCLSSINDQTYSNYELILVNDGSIDSSEKICKQYIENNPKITYFWTENGGPSKARNLGIINANGQYITFIDADDWVDANYLENFINVLSILDHKLFSQGCTIEFENRKSEIGNDNIHLASCWGNLFEREIILKNNIRFDLSMKLGEDTVFNLDYSKFINEVRYIQSYSYHYCANGDNASLTKSVSIEALILFINKLQDKLEEKYIKNQIQLLNFIHQHINEQIETTIQVIQKKDMSTSNLQFSAHFLSMIITNRESKIEKLKSELERTRSSKAFRIGKKITNILKIINTFLR